MPTYPPITGHMVVKNEDQFLWYAISSVLPYLSQLFIADTGSSDATLSIIDSFSDSRIVFSQHSISSPGDISVVRQQQIDKTTTDWFWVIDGDEVYPHHLCEEICDIQKKEGDRLEGIVVKRYDLLGDMYHYQSERVGTYHLFGKKGHHVIRLINKKRIPHLHISGVYPYEGYYDQDNREIIHHDPERFSFTQGKMWHAMYLKRSSQGARLSHVFHRKKWKIEKGISLPPDTQFPEVFFKQRPSYVPDMTGRRSMTYEILARAITPVKKIKRILF